jgi:hypothetical protein
VIIAVTLILALICPEHYLIQVFQRCTNNHEHNRTNTSAIRRAAAIKEKLDGLNKELRTLLDGAVTGKKRTMSAAVTRENCGCAKGEMGEGEAR